MKGLSSPSKLNRLMNKKIMLSVNIMIAIVAIASIALVTSFSDVQTTIADEGDEPLYKMADGTQVVITFEFREGSEQYIVPIFNQVSNFAATKNPTFNFEKTVGDTPLLHKAADMFRYWNMAKDTSAQHMYKEFTADVDIFQNGKHVRNLHYVECDIVDFETSTLSDKEEGYFGKGFAVVENVEVECHGYTPNSIDYEQMKSANGSGKAKTLSSLDLREQANVWNSHLRGQ